MSVKARPQAALILIPAQFPLGFFMELLNGMATMGIIDQFLHHRRGWQIAPADLKITRVLTTQNLSR